MSDARVKVLFIGGWQRCGSTVLGNVLNEQDRVFHAGEVCYLWTHKPWTRYRCGCGAPFAECRTWGGIFEEAFGSMAAMESYRPHRPRSVELLPRLILGRDAIGDESAGYLSVLGKLYRAMRKVTGCRVIVDSSKFPAHGCLLARVDEVDPFVLHLVRDPRGCTHSWQRSVTRSDLLDGRQQAMPKFGTVSASMKWFLWNWEIDLLGRQMKSPPLRVRYEQFAAQPAEWTARILEHIGEPALYRNVFSRAGAELGENHTVVGNPSRSRTGCVPIAADEAWRSEMPRGRRWSVVAFTFPLMFRYGYFASR